MWITKYITKFQDRTQLNLHRRYTAILCTLSNDYHRIFLKHDNIWDLNFKSGLGDESTYCMVFYCKFVPPVCDDRSVAKQETS